MKRTEKERSFRFTQSAVAALGFAATASDRPEYRDTVMQGLVLRVSRTTKTYYLVYYDKEVRQPKRYKLGTTLELTVDQARARAAQVIGAEGPKSVPVKVAEKAKEKSELFDALLEEFDREHIQKHMRPTGAGDYRYQIAKHIQPAFGHKSVRSITRNDIRELFEARSSKAPVTANKMKVVLSSIFSYALRTGKVDLNPVLGIRDNPTKPRQVILLPSDIRQLFDKLNQVEPIKRHYYWLLMLLGQRRGEVAQMQWRQLESDGLWVIPEDVTKNGKRHTVPIPPLAQRHLEKLRERNGATPYVFYCWETKHNRQATGPFDKTHLTHWMRDFWVRELKGCTPFTLHDFRRTAATGMTSALKSQEIVKKVLNHTDSSNPTNIYDLYAYDDEKLNALVKWEHMLRKMVPASIIDLSLRD